MKKTMIKSLAKMDSLMFWLVPLKARPDLSAVEAS